MALPSPCCFEQCLWWPDLIQLDPVRSHHVLEAWYLALKDIMESGDLRDTFPHELIPGDYWKVYHLKKPKRPIKPINKKTTRIIYSLIQHLKQKS